MYHVQNDQHEKTIKLLKTEILVLSSRQQQSQHKQVIVIIVTLLGCS